MKKDGKSTELNTYFIRNGAWYMMIYPQSITLICDSLCHPTNWTSETSSRAHRAHLWNVPGSKTVWERLGRRSFTKEHPPLVAQPKGTSGSGRIWTLFPLETFDKSDVFVQVSLLFRWFAGISKVTLWMVFINQVYLQHVFVVPTGKVWFWPTMPKPWPKHRTMVIVLVILVCHCSYSICSWSWSEF